MRTSLTIAHLQGHESDSSAAPVISAMTPSVFCLLSVASGKHPGFRFLESHHLGAVTRPTPIAVRPILKG